MHLLEERVQLITSLKAELVELKSERDTLHERLAQSLSVKLESVTSLNAKMLKEEAVKSKATNKEWPHASEELVREQHLPSPSQLSDDHDSEETDGQSVRRHAGTSNRRPHPQGFSKIRNHIQPFSGERGEDDFQLWLEDYEEASTNCQWDDNDRARWFSWFITGLAKATWQRMLKPADKSS